MGYKLLAIDVDGTLIGEDLLLRDNTVRVLLRCMDKGIIVTLATGRMFRSALIYAQQLGVKAPLICYNGALVKDADSGVIYQHLTIPVHLARNVVLTTREVGAHLHAYIDDQPFTEAYGRWAKRYEGKAGVKVQAIEDMESFLQQEPTKLGLSDYPERIDTYFEYLKDNLKPLNIARSHPYFVEVLREGTSKAEGLKALGKHYGIPLAEMVAVGDSYNDIEMLEEAGLAIAMGNAPADVQAKADWVTGNVEEEGLVSAIERFLLAGK